MKKIVDLLFGRFVSGRAAVGLLLIRLVVGGAFVQHGLPKIQAPFHWMGPDSPVPGIFQALAALSEFGGGLALIFGFLTPLASLGIAATMLVALFMVHLPAGNPWVGAPGKPSFEDVAFYLATVVGLLLTGPGRLSLDALLFNRHRSDAS